MTSVVSRAYPCPFVASPCVTQRPQRVRSLRPVRAEPEESKVVREYRESDDTMVSAKKPNALFADEVKEKPKDSMSPEMKARLRQEYLSLGGSTNTAMGSNYFLWIMGIVALLAVASWSIGAI